MGIPMGWVNSPGFFYATYETVTDNANGYALEPASNFVVYPPQLGRTGPPAA